MSSTDPYHYINLGLEHIEACYGKDYVPEDELDWLEILGKVVDQMLDFEEQLNDVLDTHYPMDNEGK